MPAFHDQVPLVFGRCAERTKKRQLRSLQRANEIVASIDHQRGSLDARREVERVHFGRSAPIGDATRNEHIYFDSILQRRNDWAPSPTPTIAEKRDSAWLEISPGFQIVECPTDV